MANKIKIPKKLKITIPQVSAIAEAADILSGMMGVGSDFDPAAKRILKLIDNFLHSNGYKRKFN